MQPSNSQASPTAGNARGSEFQEFRDTLLDRAVLICAVLGLPAVVFSLISIAAHGWHPTDLVHAAAAIIFPGVYALRRRISYRVKTWVFLTLFLISGGVSLAGFGLAGNGFLILFLFSTLCTVFSGPRAGSVGVGVSLGLACAIGWLIISGRITLPEQLPASVTSWSAWIGMGAAFGILAAVMVVVVGVTFRTMERSYGQLRYRTQELDTTVARLEKEIEQHRLVQSRLEEENSFSETLINMLPGSFMVLNEEGRIVRWNQFGIIRYGHTVEEIRSRSVESWVPEEEQERVLRSMQECFEQGESRLDASIVTRDGRRIPHIFNGKRIEIGGKAYALAFGLDITERHHLEEATKIQRDLAVELSSVTDVTRGLELCLEAAMRVSGMEGGGVYLIDERSGDFTLAVHQGLPPEFVAAVTHYPADSLVAKTAMRGVPIFRDLQSDDLTKPTRHDYAGLSATAAFPIRYRGKIIACLNLGSKHVTEIPQPMRNHLESIAGHIGGSIARLTAERELAKKQGLIEAFLDNSPGAVFAKDPGGRYILANRVAADILNTPCEEIEGKTNYDLMPREIADCLEENDRIVLSGRETLKAEEVVPFRDELHTFLVHKFPLRDAHGEPYALAGIALDITEAKRTNERLRQLQTDLAHADRLRTLGELATGLAHELNQPLVCLNMYAETCSRLLAEGETDPADLREALDDMVRDVDRAARIVKRFRAFGGNREKRRSSVAVNQLVRDVVAFLEHRIRQDRIDVRFALADGLPMVLADSIQIQQVVVNLLMNSIQAIVESEATLREIRIETAMTSDPAVRLAVHDSGPGLPQDDLVNVFEPFVTTRPEGMGLGLSISRTIIEEHDGRIFVKANSGSGTEFGFTLPVNSE